jgi:hypothetical protein
MTHFEHDLYRHPRIAHFASRKVLRSINDRERFRIAHDLYSLGIVLLEIGLWRRVGTLWKDKYDHERFLEKLVAAYVPRLGPKMGAMYQAVVKDLLTSSIGQDDRMSQWSQHILGDNRADIDQATSLNNEGKEEEMPESDLSTDVYWNIVQELGKCTA